MLDKSPSLDIRFLQPGDMLTLQNTETTPPTSMAYSITSKLWAKVDIRHSDGPEVILHGTVEALLPSESQAANQARLFGRGLSDATKTHDVVFLSQPPYFQLGTTNGGLMRGRLDGEITVLRPDGLGEYHNVDLTSLTGMPFAMPVHIARMQMVRDMLDKLGYTSEESASAAKPFASHRLRITHSHTPQAGEQLIVFDKLAGLWTQIQLYQSAAYELLKIGIARVPVAVADWEGNQHRLPEATDITAQGVPITTFVTSPQLGLDGVCYVPKRDDGLVALGEFGIGPEVVEDGGLAIIIGADGLVQLDGLKQERQDGALLNPAIAGNVIITAGKDATTLTFSHSIKVEIPDVDAHLEHILHLIEKAA